MRPISINSSIGFGRVRRETFRAFAMRSARALRAWRMFHGQKQKRFQKSTQLFTQLITRGQRCMQDETNPTKSPQREHKEHRPPGGRDAPARARFCNHRNICATICADVSCFQLHFNQRWCNNKQCDVELPNRTTGAAKRCRPATMPSAALIPH